MTDLIDTIEMYLRTIIDLEEEGIVPMRARISERLGHSGPTVSQTVSRMERDGLVTLDDERHLQLTEVGRDKAVSVLRKHRLAECLLVNVLALDPDLVHDEACRWEHVMSVDVERRIFETLGRPTHSPFGGPIPGLEKLGGETAGTFLDGVQSLRATLNTDVVVDRLGEPIQMDYDLFRLIVQSGILPGTTVRAQHVDNEIRVTVDGSPVLNIDLDVANHIYVKPLNH